MCLCRQDKEGWRQADPWHAQEHLDDAAQLVPLERVSQLLTLLKDVAVCKEATVGWQPFAAGGTDGMPKGSATSASLL